MIRTSDFGFSFGRLCTDVLMIFAALLLAYKIRMQWFESFGLPMPVTLFPWHQFWDMALWMTLLLGGVLALKQTYKLRREPNFAREIGELFWHFLSAYALLLIGMYFVQNPFFSRFIFGLSWGIGLIFLVGSRALWFGFERVLYRRGVAQTSVLLLGNGVLAERALGLIQGTARYRCLGVLSTTRSTKAFCGVKILGTLRKLETILSDVKPQEIWLAQDKSDPQAVHKLIQIAHLKNIPFRIIPDEMGLDLAHVEMGTVQSQPILTVLNTPMRGWGYLIKCAIDYLFAVMCLLLFAPVMAVIATLVWWSDRYAPILYVSERVGRNGKRFKIYKFRTMVPNAEALKKDLMDQNERAGGVFFKLEKDPRVTPLGALLRKTSLDELPNIWNVLTGDLSLVGPRPHTPDEVAQYPKEDRLLTTIKPGVTGYNQVNGLSNSSFEQEMEYERFYLHNWSLWLDVVILCKTAWIVLRAGNVFNKKAD